MEKNLKKNEKKWKKNEKTILKLKNKKKMYSFCTGKKCGKPGCACAHPSYYTTSVCACARDHIRSLHPHKFGFVTTYKLLTSLNNLPCKSS
jgi:hypothetical protein